ncbi:MAG: FmdB family zinc ribbon protein [Jatrophihabitantaceae bacterium]
MPTYQYACTSPQCDLRFERVQAFTDPAVSECPDCSERVRKVYGSVGVVFKGSGFYRNDSRDAKAGTGAKADGAAAKNGDGAGGKSEAAKSDAGSSSTTSTDSSSTSKGSGESSSKGKSESAKPAATVAS